MISPVSSTRQVSIVIDRRIDPNAELQLDVSNVNLLEGLRKIANLANAEVSLPENFVYLGPSRSVTVLRTLMELRSQELRSKDSGIPERRRSDLQRRQTIKWPDLSTPREILDALSEQRHLNIPDKSAIPHDLWAAAVLPDVTTAEALTLILIQFDLTFHWTDFADSIELVPTPASVTVDRKHRTSLKLSDSIAIVRQRFPEIHVETSKTETVVTGTVEAHEAISKLLSGQSTSRIVKDDPLGPVRDRTFTLSVNQPVPIIVLLQELEKSKIHFEYDAQELKTAGVDLEQTVQIDVVNASATEFFEAIFRRVKVDFQFDNTTVKLKPKSVSSVEK